MGVETKICFKCRQVKSLNDFHKNKVKKGGFSGRCKDCCKEHYHNTGYMHRQKELVLKRRYHLTLDMYEDMVLSQGDSCAICKDGTSKLNVDHNHTTGKVRGLLCHSCNLAIGLLKDDVQITLNAAEYIKNDGTYLSKQFSTLPTKRIE
jgi:hypothetical protein